MAQVNADETDYLLQAFDSCLSARNQREIKISFIKETSMFFRRFLRVFACPLP